MSYSLDAENKAELDLLAKDVVDSIKIRVSICQNVLNFWSKMKKFGAFEIVAINRNFCQTTVFRI